jgi:hypothetical protein
LDPCDMVQCRNWFGSEGIWCQMRQKDDYITVTGTKCEWSDCHGNSATPSVPKFDNLKAPSAEYMKMMYFLRLPPQCLPSSPSIYPPWCHPSRLLKEQTAIQK